MSYFDDYKARVSIQGSSESDAFDQSTISFINNNFTQSPSYRQATKNGTTTIDIRLVKGKKNDDSRNKSVIFRPNTQTPIGTYLQFDGQTWLMIDSDFTHPIVPKATLMLCNSVVNWIDKAGNNHTITCVVTANVQPRERPSIQYDKEYIDYSKDGIGMYAQWNSDTQTIQLGTRFVLGGQSYEVYGIDNLSNTNFGVGVVEVITRLVETQPTDDTTNGIANVPTPRKTGENW